MSQQEIPGIFLEGKPVPIRSFTFSQEAPDDGLPMIKDDGRSLAVLLREYKIEATNEQEFWSLRLLRHILSRGRVLNELRNYPNLDAKTYVDYIRPENDPAPDSRTPTYLKIFALLVLFERGQEIDNFVKDEVSDQSLPLLRRRGYNIPRGIVDLCHKDTPGQALNCFLKWKQAERESFLSAQWELLVPYFDLDEKFRSRHYTLHDRTILPWCKRENGEDSSSSSQQSRNEGGFAYVMRIKIDPFSHGFHNILKAIALNDGLFALKVLHEKDYNNEARFRNESAQLGRFNGLIHDHLVTLLATFMFGAKYHFLFPYAHYTLEQYWESVPKPDRDIETIRWVAKQCSGIMAAMDTIHDPKHLHNLDVVKGYGRHGDIKPDNILWFGSTTDPRGILVVSDLGLASFHRDTSRSNIPNKGIPAVPGYRPPECDIKGGTISRAYDIWTLGCLFLELLTWLLGGRESIHEFSEQRFTTFLITGSINNIFFTLKPTKVPGVHVAQVKQEVTEWISKLHNHKNCSQFIHDALTVIEEKMLIVLSQEKKRSPSGILRMKIENFYAKCLDKNNLDYCMKGVPEFHLARTPTAVQATLNETAQERMKENPKSSNAEIHEGKTNTALSAEVLENIDET